MAARTEICMADAIGSTLSKYNIVEELSSGGMGTVYLAEDTSLHRKVAIKVLTPEWSDDPERFERFQWEAQVLASLNHPNIVTIYSVEEEGGNHFLTMELVDGQTLGDMIPSVGLRLDTIFELAIPLADALWAAHQRGVIHRDLKPANIMVGKDGRVKILDFGLAKQRDDLIHSQSHNPRAQQPITQDGQLLGTIPYMSPEQIQGEPADHRSDIFSLGIILFEMATGRRPFQGKTWGDMASAILRDQPPSVTSVNVLLPRHLGRIIRHCLEKDPERRFQTALDLRNELEELRREVQTGEISATPAEILQTPISSPSQVLEIPTTPWRRLLDNERLLATLATALLTVFLFLMFWVRQDRSPPPPTTPPPSVEQSAVQTNPRIVVLPMENLGPEEDAYFAAGITEEITSRLAKVSALQVISRTTAQSYDRTGKTVQEIGRDLGVDYLLEGSVRWSGDPKGASRVRVTPQLIRVADDTHLWSGTFDKVIDDLFAVQTEIAEAVIEALGIALEAPEREALTFRPTQNVGAYQAYLRGVDYAERRDPSSENWNLAVQMLERAVELDPSFAEAHAELAEVHSQIYHLIIDHSPERLEMARSAVDRALELDPDLPAAHRALGYYYYWGHRDYSAALESFATASIYLPNDSQVREGIAYIRRRQGRFDDAINGLERALELDPKSARVAAELAETYTIVRRYAEADRYYARAIELGPDQPISFQKRAMNRILWRGDLAEARNLLETMPKQQETTSIMAWYGQDLRERNFQEAVQRVDSTPIRIIGTPWAMSPRSLLRAQVYRLAGNTEMAKAQYEAARFLLERITRDDPEDPRRRMPLALAYAGLGLKEEAVHQAQKAVELASATPDAVNGPAFLEHLAEVLATVGEADGAIDQLEHLLTIPSAISAPMLRVDPRWDSLRDHPRFLILVDAAPTSQEG